MSAYNVLVTREGDAWLADAVDVPGAHTWAKNLPTLDHDIREAIALAEDLPEGAEADLSIAYAYRTGDDNLDMLSQAVRLARARISRELREIEKATADAVRQMVDGPAHLSVRDAAALLDISPQRVSQLAPKSARGAAA